MGHRLPAAKRRGLGRLAPPRPVRSRSPRRRETLNARLLSRHGSSLPVAQAVDLPVNALSISSGISVSLRRPRLGVQAVELPLHALHRINQPRSQVRLQRPA